MKKDKEKSKPLSETWVSKWGKLDFSLYLRDFNFSIFCWLFFLIAISVLFHAPIQSAYNYFIVAPILSTCPSNIGADFIFFIIAFWGIIFFFTQISKSILPTINSLLFGLTIAILYFVFVKNQDSYKFNHFSIGLTSYTYSTVFLFSILPVIFSYKSYLKPLIKQSSQFSLLDDFPSLEKYDDIYGRRGYATSIANHIVNTSSDASFAIGVVGDWGAGKSDFLIRLKSVLESDKENITLEFNPWRVSKADAIIDEFFKTLSKQLKPFNQSISATINDYSTRVLKPARETQFKMIDAFIGTWFKEDDIQEKYDTINQAIKATAKRIIIFIDDVDRLTGKEVMEILRIIRNTANFANTFFIVGIDQNYIVNVLKNTKDFSNEEEYLKKVFQLTITLPAFKKESLVNELKKYLYTPDLSGTDKEKIRSALEMLGINADIQVPELFSLSFKHETLLEKMLDNVRDLKRFCNSFKIVFNILKNEADISDLIVLELIRNKNIEVYNNIRNKKILTVDFGNQNKLLVDNDEWAKLENQLSIKDKDVLKRSVEFLFTDSLNKNQRKIIFPHNFYIYFSYQLFDLISFHEFNETIAKSENEIIETFNNWIANGKEGELLRIVGYVGDFESTGFFKKIIIALLKIWRPGSSWFEQVKQMIYMTWEYNHKKYFQSNNELHRRFIFDILENESLDSFIRASLAFNFIRGLTEGTFDKEHFFLKKKELRNLNYHLFDEYLNSNPTDAYRTIEFFYLNDYKIENEHVIRFPPACRRFKNHLLSNDEGFQGYIKILLRPSQFPYNGKLVLEPWIEQIFPDWKVFQARLANVKFSDESLNRLKNIILEYLGGYFNSGKKSFEIQNKDDQLFVENLL